MHTLLGLHGNIPTFIRVTSGDVGDVNILGEIMPEAGAFYVMDRGYIDFQRLYVITLSSVFFVVRTKSNVLLQRRQSHPVDKSTGVRLRHAQREPNSDLEQLSKPHELPLRPAQVSKGIHWIRVSLRLRLLFSDQDREFTRAHLHELLDSLEAEREYHPTVHRLAGGRVGPYPRDTNVQALDTGPASPVGRWE